MVGLTGAGWPVAGADEMAAQRQSRRELAKDLRAKAEGWRCSQGSSTAVHGWRHRGMWEAGAGSAGGGWLPGWRR